MNASKKSRYVSSETNIPQGGGSKKAGLPGTVGHGHWFAVYTYSNANSLTNLRNTANPFVCQSRPTGSIVQFNTYWHCAGTGR
jgi:hypothetical protein